MVNVNELRAQRAEIFAAAELLVNKSRESKKDLQGADLEQYNNHVAELRNVDSILARHEEIRSLEGKSNDPASRLVVANQNDNRSEDVKHFDAFIRTGVRKATTGLNVGTATEGGTFVPTDLFGQFITKKVQSNVVRGLCRQIQTSHPTNFAVQNGRATASWTAEEAAASTVKPTISSASVGAHKATSMILVSEEILQDSAFDVVSYVIGELGYAFGQLEETAFISGSGNTQPSGLLPAATAGETAAAVAAVTSDEIIKLYHALPVAYRAFATFLMHDTTTLALRLLKNTVTGDYMWQPGLQAGVPDRLLGRPVSVSAKMPVPAAGVRSVVFGDFSNYLVCDRTQFSIQRLNELYAATGQVGFRGVERVDGLLVNAEGLVALTQAAS